jgi:hypothetical protein
LSIVSFSTVLRKFNDHSRMPKDSDLESPFADVGRYYHDIFSYYISIDHPHYYVSLCTILCSNRDSAVFATDDLDSMKMT